jgi:predicted transcriptional regulator of viral defense system
VDSVLARMTRRGKLARVARGVYRIPYFPADRLSQYREAILWARASHGPEKVALSHETALAVFCISDVNPSQIHITVPQGARLRRQKPKWIAIHRETLSPSEVTMHEGLPVTTMARSALDVADATGRLGLARQAIKDARKEGYIGSAEANRITRQLNQLAYDGKLREAAGECGVVRLSALFGLTRGARLERGTSRLPGNYLSSQM